jgi:hypothetical protein
VKRRKWQPFKTLDNGLLIINKNKFEARMLGKFNGPGIDIKKMIRQIALFQDED